MEIGMALQAPFLSGKEESQFDEDALWDVDVKEVLQPRQVQGVYELNLASFFNASHRVMMHDSLGPQHRHSFHLRVTAQTHELSEGEHVVVPYEALRRLIDRITRSYEGTVLNELPPFKHLQPTAENLVGVIAQQLIKLSEGLPLRIVSVTVMESPTQGVTFRVLNGERVNGWSSNNGSGQA
jgi:6-pyruvoyltetrahydropterin/6-carboxytetrahydropterin synthase